MTEPSCQRRLASQDAKTPSFSPAETPASAGVTNGFGTPRVLIPFIIITLIWGSTWIVIHDQLGPVPPAWSVTYRYIIGTAAMFLYAAGTKASLRIGREGHLLAIAFGIPQFVLNFNFVYAAEQYITSGVVAVVFALLLVPNSALAWIFLKHPMTRRFLVGSAVAMAGVALLFVNEVRHSNVSPTATVIGIGLTFLGVLSASAANVMQGSERLRARPISSMLAWGMFYGTLVNAAFAFALYGGPVVEYRLGYWLGVLYLGVFASALAFTFYFQVLRAVGPARAAYSSLLVPIIAMALSTIFEDYHWSALAVAGGLLALFGLAIALRSRRVAEPPDAA